MQLKIGKHNGISAVVPVTWCLSDQEVQHLTKDLDRKYFVIISVIKPDGNSYYEERRYCRPLTDQMAYVEFRNPGEHLILAGVMYNGYNKKRFLNIDQRCNGYNVYSHNLIYKENENWRLANSCLQDLGQSDMRASLSVNIDEKLFAPKPVDYDLVGRFFDTAPIDECHHRKRRFLAYFMLLTVAPLVYLFRLAWFLPFLLLTGLYARNWRWFLHPFRETWSNEEYLFAYAEYRDKDGKLQQKPTWRQLTHWRMIFFIWPTLLCVLCAILELLLLLLKFLAGYWALFSFIGTIAMALAAILLIVAMTYVMTWSRIKKRYRQWRTDRQEAQKQLRRQARKQIVRELRQLGCDLAPKEVSLKALPRQKQTVYLRFNALKAQICRPFAGSLKD
jgi:hypothetical protein